MTVLLTPAVGDAAIGGVVGFASGFALKKVTKLVVILSGLCVLLLQYLQVTGVVNIDYEALQGLGQRLLGKISEANQLLVGLSIPIGASFAAGFTLGLYKG